MFGHLKSRFFIAKVMAEIKAQNPNQDFVDRLFSTNWAAETLEQLRTQAYYRNDADAPFIYGCNMLEQGMLDQSLDTSMRATCCYLLADRLQKANVKQHFWQRHILIFGGMHDALMDFKAQHGD